MENKRSVPDGHTYSREELQEMLTKMHNVSSAFYVAAQRTGCHAFIEFTGLMNEFIKTCRRAFDEGQDFTQANVHSGQALPMKTYEADYLGEKFECIYGPTLADDPALARAFMRRVIGDEGIAALAKEKRAP